MSSLNQVLILGSGTSTGVPVLACPCEICHSTNPKNKRMRSSILIKTKAGQNILVDTSPDLRTQLLANKINMIDATIITHTHADHVHGIDDLRTFGIFKGGPIPLYSNQRSIEDIKHKFSYIFDNSHKSLGGGVPKLDVHKVSDFEPVSVLGEEFLFFEMPHGRVKTLGMMHSKLAYVVDCITIPQKAIQLMQQRELEILIIDCARRAPHDTHLHLDKALKYIEQIAPKQAYLTHLGHDFDYNELTQELKTRGHHNVSVSFDGLSLTYD